MTILDEIQIETWHLLTTIYTHKRMMESLPQSLTRYEMADKFVALNALAEMLIIRIARLADKRRDVRTVSMLLQRGTFPAPMADVDHAAQRFLSLAEPVVKIRHEQVAHMKMGVLSSYEPQVLPNEALRATEALIHLIDVARQKVVLYEYKVGSMEAVIDLRASLAAGSMIPVNAKNNPL
ncbi:hypothetical protein ACI7YU_18670 [Pseudomonas siliginis]|uniref:hypothetical protein n=1 Tax=Pseudomonas siliginis TaxID=2842346 RepID=UPI00386D6881